MAVIAIATGATTTATGTATIAIADHFPDDVLRAATGDVGERLPRRQSVMRQCHSGPKRCLRGMSSAPRRRGRVAEALSEAVMRTLGYGEESISVGIGA